MPRDFDRFRERFLEHGDGWSSLWLAELDGTPVGLLVGTRQFEEDDDAGYVRRLGVIPAGRGHGVAKALLRHYFSASQAEGRVAVLLHVDVANVTNALGVYSSVGMRPILEIDAWAKRAPSTLWTPTHHSDGESVERESTKPRQPAFGQHAQGTSTRGLLLAAQVGHRHDSRLTIGSRERVARPTTAAVSSGSPMTRPSTSSHGTSRKWSAIGAPAASRLPFAQDALVNG